MSTALCSNIHASSALQKLPVARFSFVFAVFNQVINIPEELCKTKQRLILFNLFPEHFLSSSDADSDARYRALFVFVKLHLLV